MFDCILECSGIGAKAFLQGQLTCNLNDLKENQPQLTACCNLQGRVIFTAYVVMKVEQNFLLLIPESMKTIVVTHLEKYARFSKCIINGVGAAPPCPPEFIDNKSIILNGIPTIYPETSEKIIPQRLNLHVIPGAMSFKKGCYLGQEVIARLHFKGTLKHHMLLGSISNKNTVTIGEKILNDRKEETGLIVDAVIEGDTFLFLFIHSLENQKPQLLLPNGECLEINFRTLIY